MGIGIGMSLPNGPQFQPLDLSILEQLIARPCMVDWTRGSGDVMIERRSLESSEVLILGASDELQIHIHYSLRSPDVIGPVIYLSLGNQGSWEEWLQPWDEWNVSSILFISPADAWKATKYFCEQGGRYPGIQWIESGDVPDAGNY